MLTDDVLIELLGLYNVPTSPKGSGGLVVLSGFVSMQVNLKHRTSPSITVLPL